MNILRNLKNKYSLNPPEDVKKIVELLSKLRT